VPNAVTRAVSNELYMAAALLLIFGFDRTNYGVGPNRSVQIVLALGCAGAAFLVRHGGSVGRLAGLAAAGSTVGYGAFCLWTGRGFVVGCFICVYALVQLLGSADAFSSSPVQALGHQVIPGQLVPGAQCAPAPYQMPYQPYAGVQPVVAQQWAPQPQWAPTTEWAPAPQWPSAPQPSAPQPSAPHPAPSLTQEQMQHFFAPPAPTPHAAQPPQQAHQALPPTQQALQPPPPPQ
jgi:hypothetical protein